METQRFCSECKKTLPPNAPQGVCPECLLKAGLGTGVDLGPDTETGPIRPGFVPPSATDLAPLFPQLEILGLIGQGGMGAVYKARQKELDRVVALKILPPDIGQDASFAERFTREARALAKLNHPGIVTIYDFGRAGSISQSSNSGTPLPLYYFLMEFVDGVNLRQLLAASRLSSREALAIVPQICDALQYAHDQGIVHRDIKPENILMDRQGRVKVADFGLAKLVQVEPAYLPANPDDLAGVNPNPDPTSPEPPQEKTPLPAPVLSEVKVMGTPHYMAPEQQNCPREVDHRADIYALGVVFYQMLTGELPGQKIEPPSKKVLLDVRLDEVVLRALEKEPERRYQTAAELRTQIETVISTPAPTGSRPANQAPGPRISTSPALTWSARLLGLLGFGFVLLFILAEGFPPFWKQPTAVRTELISMVLMLTGLLTGWKREGLGATFITMGWACFLVAERGWPPWAFTFFLVVAGLYAWGWWRKATAEPGRRWRREVGLAAGSIVLAMMASALLVRFHRLQVPGFNQKAETGAYEIAVPSDAALSVQVGSHRFAVRSVVRNDRGGILHFEDGRGTPLNTVDFTSNPQLVRQSEWLDLVNVSFGIPESGPKAQEYFDVIEARVFDHQTRELLGSGKDCWGVGWDLQDPGVLQIRAAGQPLPDTVDVWFRLASHTVTNGQIWLRPVPGSATNLADGQLTIREVRNGQWGYHLQGSQLSWFEKPLDPVGCTLVLEWNGQWTLGRHQVQIIDTAARGRRVFPPGAPHFVDFHRMGRRQILHFDVPLARVDAVILRPFGGRHTFYFRGVKLPPIGQRTLRLPPAVEWRLDGLPAQAQLNDLDPLILRLTALRGRTDKTSSLFMQDPDLDPARYAALAGPVLRTNEYSTFLFRAEGLGQVPVQITLLDRQHQTLPQPVSGQSVAHYSSGSSGPVTAGLNSWAVPLDRIGFVRIQIGRPVTGATTPSQSAVTTMEHAGSTPPSTNRASALSSSKAPDFLRAVSLREELLAVAEPMFLYFRDTNRPSALASAQRWLALAQNYNQCVQNAPVDIPRPAFQEMTEVVTRLQADRWDEAAKAFHRFDDSDRSPSGSRLLYYADQQEAARLGHADDFTGRPPPVELAGNVKFDGVVANGTFLDLDTARQHALPEGLDASNPEKMQEWIEKTGVDVQACIVNDWGILTNLGLTVIELPEGNYFTLNEGQVALRSARSFPSPARLGPPPGTRADDIPQVRSKSYVFRTREGGIGQLQTTLSQRQGPRIYFRLTERLAPEEASRLKQPPDLATSAFGPIRRAFVAVGTSGRPLDCWDLTSGKLYGLPPNLDRTPAAITNWMPYNGGDFIAEPLADSVALRGLNLRLIPVASTAWDEWPVSAVIALATPGPLWSSKLLRLGSRWPQDYDVPPGYLPLSPQEARQWQWPDTHVFRNHNGAMGLLQIVGPIQQPRGVEFRYKLVVPPGTPTTPREVVAEWLRLVKNDLQSKEAWNLTTRSNVGAGLDFIRLWEYDRIRPRHQFGNEQQAMVLSNPFRDNSGRTNVFYALLMRREGQWLIARHSQGSPKEVTDLARGFSMNPGMKFDVRAEELVGHWLGPCLEFTLSSDGTGSWLVTGPEGPLPQPQPFQWEANGDTLVMRDSQATRKCTITWVEDDSFNFRDQHGQGHAVWRHHEKPGAPNSKPSNAPANP